MYEIDKRIIVITVVAIGALAGMQLLFVPPAVAQSAQPRFLDRALPAGTRAADLVAPDAGGEGLADGQSVAGDSQAWCAGLRLVE